MSYTVSVVVTAEPTAVWERLAEVARWPEWNPACLSSAVPSPITVGDRLRLELRLPRGRAFLTAPVVTCLDAPDAVAWETRALGVRAPTLVQLAADDDGTRVTLTSESRGVLGFAYRLTFPEKTQAQLWSGALTGLAHSFHSSETPSES
jgi:hypothetical protein